MTRYKKLKLEEAIRRIGNIVCLYCIKKFKEGDIAKSDQTGKDFTRVSQAVYDFIDLPDKEVK